MVDKKTKTKAKVSAEPAVMQNWTPQQRIVVYGIGLGLVLTLISLVIANASLSMVPFHYGYFIFRSGTIGGGAVSVHGWPFGYLGLSTIATYFAYFAFLLDFIIYTIIAIVIGINYKKIRRE